MSTPTLYKANIWMWGGWGNWFKQDTDVATLQEVPGRKIEEPRPHYFRGQRVFVCLTADAVEGAHDMHGNVFPNWPGALADEEPKVSKTAISWGFIQGLAAVTAFYESTGVGFCRIFTKDINRPIVRKFEPGFEGDMTEDDPDFGPDHIIEGRESDGVHEWRVVSGRNDWMTGDMFFRLDTSYEVGTAPYNAWEALKNTVNNASVVLGTYGTAGIRTLWFHGAITSRERFGNIVDASLFFQWSKTAPWNTRCKTQRGVWVSQQHFVLDTAGNETTETRTRMVYRPGYYLTDAGDLATWVGEDVGGLTTSKVVGAEADFSTLNLGTLVGW